MSVDHAKLLEILGGSKGVVIVCPDSDNIAEKEVSDFAMFFPHRELHCNVSGEISGTAVG